MTTGVWKAIDTLVVFTETGAEMTITDGVAPGEVVGIEIVSGVSDRPGETGTNVPKEMTVGGAERQVAGKDVTVTVTVSSVTMTCLGKHAMSKDFRILLTMASRNMRFLGQPGRVVFVSH